MDTIAEYLSAIDNPQHRARVEEIVGWIRVHFPQLGERIAWNQPMFTDHGTYILGLNIAKKHLNISPEAAGITRFSQDILDAGYTHTPNLFQIGWDKLVDYALLEKMIRFNLEDKAECKTFFRN